MKDHIRKDLDVVEKYLLVSEAPTSVCKAFHSVWEELDELSGGLFTETENVEEELSLCIHCGKPEQDVDGGEFIPVDNPNNKDEVIHLRCAERLVVLG